MPPTNTLEGKSKIKLIFDAGEAEVGMCSFYNDFSQLIEKNIYQYLKLCGVYPDAKHIASDIATEALIGLDEEYYVFKKSQQLNVKKSKIGFAGGTVEKSNIVAVKSLSESKVVKPYESVIFNFRQLLDGCDGESK